MNATIAIIIATALIIMGTLLPAHFINRKSKTSEEDWAVASRSLPIYVVIGTQLASAMGGGILVGQVGNAFNNGLSLIIYGILAALPFIFIMYPAKWLRSNNFTTVPEILRSFSNQSKVVTVVAAIMTIIVPFGWVTSQITAFGSIYSQITGLNYEMLCIIFCLVSLLFVMPSGLKTVAWADFVFACFIIFMCIVSLFYVTHMSGGIDVVKQSVDPKMLTLSGSIEKTGVVTVFLWIFAVLPGGVTNQLYFQRICAIDDEKKVNKSLIISAILLLSTYFWAAYMGINIKAISPNIEGANATGWFMSQLPLIMLAGFAALIFAAMMSTLAGGVQSVVVNITRDIIPVVKPDLQSKNALTISRILSLITIIVALVMCLKFTDTLAWLTSTYAFSAATLLCPIYVGYAFRNKKFITKSGIVASMIAGIIGCIVGAILNTAINYAAIGIAFSFIALMVVSALTKEKA